MLLLLTLLPLTALADLPTEIDPFLEKLFEFEECEEFVSNADFVSVATSSCKPFTCDFPREVCQRPANSFRDESANQCKTIPPKCITAANGGVLPPSSLLKPLFPPPSPVLTPFSLVTMPPPDERKEDKKVDIGQLCQMEAPVGRFCGFVRKWTYNRDTGRCDHFWFPGCKTRETNANLFDKQAVCEELALLCRDFLTPTTTERILLPTTTFPHFSPITLAPLPTPPPTRPPPPHTPKPRVTPPSPSINNQGGQGGGGGGGGIFGQPSGGGEFGNNIVSLIAQGFMGGGGGRPNQPQAPRGNSNAAQALNVLSQFTNFEFGNLPDLLG